MAWHRARRGLAGPPHAALGLGDPDHPEAAAPRRPRALRLAGQRAAAAVHDAVHRVRHPDFRGGAAGTGDHPRGRLLLAADARHHGDADADPRAHPRRAGLAVDRGRGPPFRRLASGAVTVKFLRHLAAVVLVVAVIVGLGMLWARTSGGAGPGPAPSPPGPPAAGADQGADQDRGDQGPSRPRVPPRRYRQPHPDLRDRGGAGGRRDHGQRRPAAAPPDTAYRRPGVARATADQLAAVTRPAATAAARAWWSRSF